MTEPTMKTWISHKRVQAAPIVRIGVMWAIVGGGYNVTYEASDGSHQVQAVPENFLSRYTPQTGDYLVCYEDGYFSVSPKKAFEDGYDELRAGDPDVNRTLPQIERAAELCHEANRAICEATGDMTQKPWAEAESWQQGSAVTGVRYAVEHPDATPADQHEAWCRDKVAAGWVWGETKDAQAKTHPCLVGYHELPREQQIKDHVFRAIVRTMLGS